jgi:hypothetical protein
MINRDSNNSIIRTNIFSKSVGGKRKKNKTLKKHKGGFSFFGENPCQMEEENYNNKRKMFIKDSRVGLLHLREQFKTLLNNLKEDTRIKCQEYTKAQKELTQQQEMQKPKKSFSFFNTKLKYKGGYLTKTMKKEFKKEFNHQEKIFNSYLYDSIKRLYDGGGDADYCASIIKEYQEKVIELKKNFDVLIDEYIDKNYNEPLQQARALFNQCALKHNEGEVEIPVNTRPKVPVHQTSNRIETDTKKLFASLVSGPEYVNGKLQKPVIIAPNKPEEKKKDKFEEQLEAVKALSEQQEKIKEAAKGLAPQQQKSDNKKEEIEFDGKKHTQDSVKQMDQNQKEELKRKIEKYITDNPKLEENRKKELNNKLKQWASQKKK